MTDYERINNGRARFSSRVSAYTHTCTHGGQSIFVRNGSRWPQYISTRVIWTPGSRRSMTDRAGRHTAAARSRDDPGPGAWSMTSTMTPMAGQRSTGILPALLRCSSREAVTWQFEWTVTFDRRQLCKTGISSNWSSPMTPCRILDIVVRIVDSLWLRQNIGIGGVGICVGGNMCDIRDLMLFRKV